MEGVPNRTVIQQGNECDVLLFDKGGEGQDEQIKRLASRKKLDLDGGRGYGEFIGTETKEEAAEVFRRDIEASRDARLRKGRDPGGTGQGDSGLRVHEAGGSVSRTERVLKGLAAPPEAGVNPFLGEEPRSAIDNLRAAIEPERGFVSTVKVHLL